VYIDENIPPQFAKAFNLVQDHLNNEEKKPIKVYSIKDSFGEGCADEDWIPKVGENNGIVISNDRRIQRNKHQRELYNNCGVGILFLNNPKSGRSFWDTFKHLVKFWPNIKQVCRRDDPPFAYRQPGKNKNFEKWE
jgi:hypothetical protein